MLPGRLLHAFASRFCSASTCEQVVEPLIADLQREYEATSARGPRATVLLRGYGAFAKTLLLCGLRALVTGPGRVTFDRAITWSYGIGIALVMVLGADWVWTGELSATRGLQQVGRLTALVPQAIWARFSWSVWQRGGWRSTGLRATIRALTAVSAAAVVACWLNPSFSAAIVAFTALYVTLGPALQRVARVLAS